MSDKVENPKRAMVVKELIHTEGTYVKNLTTIINVFMIPLQTQKILDDEQIKFQFGSVKIILEKHQQLLDSLVKASINEIGLVMSTFSKELYVYEDYLVNFDAALLRRAALLSTRKFAMFLDSVRNSPECGGQGIESYLIAPVQRIPRYRLLLQELIKYTNKSTSSSTITIDGEQTTETVQLTEALERISEVAAAHNEAIRRRETKDLLMSIMLQFDFRCRVNLLDAERALLRVGLLGKQCRSVLFFFCFLFIIIILYIYI